MGPGLRDTRCDRHYHSALERLRNSQRIYLVQSASASKNKGLSASDPGKCHWMLHPLWVGGDYSEKLGIFDQQILESLEMPGKQEIIGLKGWKGIAGHPWL